MQSAFGKLKGKTITAEGLFTVNICVNPQYVYFYSFSNHLLLFLKTALCFNTENDSRKKQEICKCDKLCLLNVQRLLI